MKKLFSAKFILVLSLLLVLPVTTLLVLEHQSTKSKAQVSSSLEVSNPSRLAIVYSVPKDRSSGQELTDAQIAQKFDVLIYHRQFNNRLLNYRAQGFDGDAVQYILHDELSGPIDMNSTTAQVTPCTSTQKTFQSAWQNNITQHAGDFCQIHDSIVTKTPFDHDLNPTTPSVIATEDWFLHRSDNNYRIMHDEGMPGGRFYWINPSNLHYRQFYIARALRELKGSATVSKTAFDGIFLDNVALSFRKILRYSPDIKEYPKATAGQKFSDDVYSFVKDIYTAMHTGGNNFKLWGNMIEGDNNGYQWDRYTDALDGGFLEDFALNWGNGYHSDQTIMNQLTQAEKWFAAGKDYVAVSQGRASNSLHDTWGKFALANFLLVTDGINGSFHHANAAQYGPHYEYEEYKYKLGAPKGRKVLVSSSPLTYRRDFDCGSVQVNITQKTYSITPITGCMAGITSTPTAALTPSISPTPTVVPSVSPTLSPSPTVAPSVSPTLSPSPSPTASPTTANGSTITVYASGTYSSGAYANMKLLINNIVYMNRLTSGTNTAFRYVHTDKVSANQVKVGFDNDNGSRDLRVDKITIDGVDYQTEASDTYADYGTTGCKSGFTKSEYLWCNGTFAYKQAQTTTSTATIYAAGTRGSDGLYPTMHLLVNGAAVKTFANVQGNPAARSFVAYTHTQSAPIVANQVRVAFTNDNGSRDLYVDRIVIDGVTYQTEASSTYTSSPGCPTGFVGYETLWCNGYFQYMAR